MILTGVEILVLEVAEQLEEAGWEVVTHEYFGTEETDFLSSLAEL